MTEGVITPLSGQLAQQSSPPQWTARTGQTGTWEGASPASDSQLLPSLSVICTCQWEAVVTDQIMAERKLLQGCDILAWQYGDVKYIQRGRRRKEERDPVLEKGAN